MKSEACSISNGYSCSKKKTCQGPRGGIYYLSKSGNKQYCSKKSKHSTSHKKVSLISKTTTGDRRTTVKKMRDELNTIKVNYKTRNIYLRGENKLYTVLQKQKPLGSGQWGSVYSGKFSNPNIPNVAVKFTSVERKSVTLRYNEDVDEWEDVFFTRDISKLVENGICPNLPILIADFLHNDKKHPGIITIFEEADGSLEKIKFSQHLTSDIQWYSMLFQIMAGLHTLHSHLWFHHRDIKIQNILYHKVKPGGYWRYKILGKEYDIPNVGFLIIITDFNIGMTLDPRKPYFKGESDRDVGNRAIIWNNKHFSVMPLPEFPDSVRLKGTHPGGSKMRKGQSLIQERDMHIVDKFDITEQQSEYIRKRGFSSPTSTKFLLDTKIQMPLEFQEDVQDAIRMFTGGLRVADKCGSHSTLGAPDSIKEYLSTYLGDEYDFTLKKSHAGYFIQDAFGSMFTPKKSHEIIQKFNIS